MKTEAGFLISQIKQIGGRLFDKILSEENIDEFNGAQGKILYVLWQKDKISIAELSKQVGLATTTLTSMLDRMEASGLICRLSDSSDRRKYMIALTSQARNLKDKYEAVSQKMNNIYFKGFSENEITEFEQYLHRVLDNIREEK